MKLLSYLFPQVLYRGSSRYNQSIVVVELNGKRQLKVNGIQQTGPYDEAIFRQAFESFVIDKRKNINTALMIGLGGGFVPKLIHHSFPQAMITCVDIDTTMVEIAKKYFGLDQIPEISYQVADAQAYIKSIKEQYDLIIIDLYIGDEVPEFVENTSFLKNIKARLNSSGAILINYQSHPRYQQRAEQLQKNLKQLFTKVESKNIRRNLFFFAEY